MEHIEAIALCRVPQIQHGNIVAIVFFGDRRVASEDIAFCVADSEAHAGRTAIFNIRIQKFCRFANARGADHQRMDVALIHDSGYFFLFSKFQNFAADNDSLRQIRWIFPSPFLRPVIHTAEGFGDFPWFGEAGGAMLAIANCFAFDIQRPSIGEKHNGKECAECQQQRQQCRDLFWHFEHLLYDIKTLRAPPSNSRKGLRPLTLLSSRTLSGWKYFRYFLHIVFHPPIFTSRKSKVQQTMLGSSEFCSIADDFS